MNSEKAKKRIALLALIVLVLALFSSASVAQQPDGGQLESVACGDNIVCDRSNPAVKVTNDGSGNAFYGLNRSGGVGVKGKGSIGVRGKSTNNIGVYAESDTGTGLFARGGLNSPSIVITENGSDDGLLSSDPDDAGSDLFIMSLDEIYLYMDDDDDEASSFILHDAGVRQFRVDDGVDSSWYARWEAGANDLNIRSRDDMFMHVNDEEDGQGPGCFQILAGDDSILESWCAKGPTYVGSSMDVDGQVNALVSTSQGVRRLSAVESPSAWVEDFGSGQLADGAAVVNLDGLFLETVNTSVDYHVFLTPVGSEAVLLFVTAKMPGSFEVQGVTLDGSAASIGFDYRIVAKQAGYEGVRLDAVQQMGADGEEFPTAPPKARPVEEDID